MGGNSFKYIAPVAGAALGAAFLGPMIAPALASMSGGAAAGAGAGTLGAAGAGAGTIGGTAAGTGAGTAAGTAGATPGLFAELAPALALEEGVFSGLAPALGTPAGTGAISPTTGALLGNIDKTLALEGIAGGMGTAGAAGTAAGKAAIPTLFGMKVPTIAKVLGGGVGGSLGSLAAGGDPLAGGAGGALIGGPIAGAFGGKEKDVIAAGPTLGGASKAAQTVKSAPAGPIGATTRPRPAIEQPQGGMTHLPPTAGGPQLTPVLIGQLPEARLEATMNVPAGIKYPGPFIAPFEPEALPQKYLPASWWERLLQSPLVSPTQRLRPFMSDEELRRRMFMRGFQFLPPTPRF